ncbi:MAG: hypothetical protein NTZ17_19475 [Phycisphaerae bacterium]|nr:hypothetical protein [Phycisphaerae bacterium]
MDRGIRLFWGFLLTPVLVPLTLYGSLHLVTAYFHPSLSGIHEEALRMFVLTVGVGMVYLCVLCFGLPYVLLVLRAGRLSFRTVMLPTLMLSWIFSMVVYFSLQKDYPFAGTVAALCVPGVIFAGLCFYFIGVWRSHGDDTQASPLLEAYPGQQKPTLQV